MTRTDLSAFLDLVNDLADGFDGWSELLDAMTGEEDQGVATLADELRALRSTMDDGCYLSTSEARACGFSHRDLLRLLEAGILSEVAEVGDGFRVSFTGLGSLPLPMVAA